MVCDEEGVGGSINLRSKNGAMGTPCVIASTLMMLIATVASEAGRCILAVSLQGTSKLLLMGQKVTLVLPPEAISSASIVLWRRPFFAVRTHATSSGPS